MKIIQFSIPRLIKRQESQRTHLIKQGVPPDCIEVFNGPDNRDYAKTRDIFEAVVADGFSHYQRYLDDKYDEWMSAAIAAQMWGYCKLFRCIIEKGETCLVIHDDWVLVKKYEDFLSIRAHAEQVADREKTLLKFIALHHTHRREDMWITPVPIAPEGILVQGIFSMGADVAFIITPIGANWILENWTLPYMHPTLECVFKVFMTEMKTLREAFDTSGIYSIAEIGNVLSNPDDFKSEIFTDTPHGRAGREFWRPIEETRR